MDVLHTCYQSYMRLYPDDPDRLTLGRWVWCPDDAEYLPFEHSFLSSKWDPFSWRVDPDVGEVRGLVGYSSGKITPRFTGKHFCGAVILYQEGSPLDLMGTPAVDEDGVPLCCDAPPAIGGLAMGGQGNVLATSMADLWWTPEGLDSYAVNDPIDNWPDASVNGRFGFVPLGGVHRPIRMDGPAGLPAAKYDQFTAVGYLALPCTNFAAYIVATTLGSGTQRCLPRFGSDYGTGGAKGLLLSGGGIAYADDLNTVGGVSPTVQFETNIWSYWRDGDRLREFRDGVLITDATIDPAGRLNLNQSALSPLTIPRTGTALLSEVAIFAALTWSDALNEMMLGYLNAKYFSGGDDVIAGTIIAYAGSSLPTGYLACDGSDVSRTTYADLFAAIGTTWGAGDGITTFTLPDLRGRSQLGSGTGGGLSPRALADLGGEENHTLNVAELAGHFHTIIDPGHQHVAGNALPFMTDQGTGVPPTGFGQGGSTTTTTDNQVTGITGTNPAGLDTGHNTMHPFAVVVYLIKT